MYRVRVRFLLSVQLKGSGGGIFLFVCLFVFSFLFVCFVCFVVVSIYFYGISRQCLVDWKG